MSLLVARRGIIAARPAAGGGGDFSPDDIAGLEAWFSADQISGSDDDPISQWDDQSGNGRHLVQATGANQPLLKTGILNGLPVVRFDGSNDSLKHGSDGATAFITGKTATLLMVGLRRGASNRLFSAVDTATDSDTNVNEFLHYQSPATSIRTYSAGNKTVISGVANDTPYITSCRFNGTQVHQRLNGTSASPGSDSDDFNIRQFAVARNATAEAEYSQWDFAEILLYSSSLTDGEWDQVESYLGDKYGITL